MSNPFLAEIRIFGFNFPPIGWAVCNGQLLPLAQNTALFSLLGTTYGGDGKSNFALPDLQGCVPLQPGQGPGLSLYDLGDDGGVDSVTLLQSEIPVHTHQLRASSQNANSGDPTGNSLAVASGSMPYDSASTTTGMSPFAVQPAGGGLPHNNMQPSLVLNFCIALQGLFPQRP